MEKRGSFLGKRSHALLVTFLMILLLVVIHETRAAEEIELTQTENHHIVELNSNQPYVAGYHVNTPDLYTRERVQATAITVSFPSTDTSQFPDGSWLGGGMFVQGQDSRIINVDYAFYTILVLDASGDLFLDIGLYQTRESSVPLQMPTEELLYAYTWQISGTNAAIPAALVASWDSEGFVRYSLATSGTNITVSSINVASLPNCESIIRQFYAGDATSGNAFPLGHYVYYFQFGVISNKIIASNHWSADLKDPMIQRSNGWNYVDIAWSTQGDISYLDSDWMWGGVPYQGVSAHYYRTPLEDPYEVIFFYNGEVLPPGTVLWQTNHTTFKSSVIISMSQFGQALSAVITFGVVSIYIGLYRPRKKASDNSVSDSS
jgi:hypothetical protein